MAHFPSQVRFWPRMQRRLSLCLWARTLVPWPHQRTLMDVYPSLTYRDLEAALEFLEQAFGLEPEVLGADEQGAIRHAAVRHGEGLVLLQPDLPDQLHGTHLGQGWVYVAVTDPDGHFERARAA